MCFLCIFNLNFEPFSRLMMAVLHELSDPKIVRFWDPLQFLGSECDGFLEHEFRFQELRSGRLG